MLFAGDYYYPGGGRNDFEGCFDTIEEAIHNAKNQERYCGYDWIDILDLQIGEWVDMVLLKPFTDID